MGDEIHLKDTISELNSLSERFGLNLLFAKPSNEEFLEIAKKLAEKYLQNYNEEEVLSKIKRHCLIKGTNSPRVIQQAIDLIRANVEF
jgi:predicted AAA+ superfamily ATPase